MTQSEAYLVVGLLIIIAMLYGTYCSDKHDRRDHSATPTPAQEPSQ